MPIQNRVKGPKYSKYRANIKWYMGHMPKGRHKSRIQLRAMQQNPDFPIDHEDFSHLLTSIN